MTGPSLSVIVVSSGRAQVLRRCVLGLSQLAHAGCEVVVVADAPGLDALKSLPFVERIKTALQDRPNISRARNTGISLASGDIIAFVDDDAVPEPTWADALCSAFSNVTLAAVTGPVLGRNGISIQWGPLAINNLAHDMPIEPNAPIRPGFYRKLQGTNMAFRRSVLAQVGGFDEAFAFYLDDTDLSFRIGEAGLATQWVAQAVVHHGFEASTRRTAERVPLNLEDIGASTAVFLRKHAPPAERADALRDLEAGQSSRLLRLARKRKLDDHAMRSLMEGLRTGIEAGMDRPSEVPDLPLADEGFTPMMQADPPRPLVLAGRSLQANRLRQEAASHVDSGQPVSLFLFEPTPRKHKVRFTDGGWWEQTGGLFGPSVRSEPRFSFQRFGTRLNRERRRISATRGI